MTRTKIPEPESYIFSTEIPIRIGDINRANHLSHVAFVVIIEEARTQFLQSRNVQMDTNGPGYIISDLAITYLAQGRYGQTLKIDIAVEDFTHKGFDIIYTVKDSTSGIELARAKTGLVFFDYQRQKVTNVPQGLKELLTQSQSG